MEHTLTPLTAPTDLFDQVRALVPRESITYSQAKSQAERQALRMRRLLDSKEATFDFSWLLDHPNVMVEFKPEYKMPNHVSGMTTKIDDKLVSFINGSESYYRQRFTLAHELKHMLDFDTVDETYAKLGHGDEKLHDDQIEWICNHFAANLLMPKMWLSRLWAQGIQDTVALAEIFQVSTEAMRIRLQQLGFTGLVASPHPNFFRRTVLPTCKSVAAAGQRRSERTQSCTA